jgi:hypothetical protein
MDTVASSPSFPDSCGHTPTTQPKLRWNDPLVQVRLMIGFFMVSAIAVTISQKMEPGERKSSLMEQLRAASQGGSFHPDIQLNPASLATNATTQTTAAPAPDFARRATADAATRSGWQFLSPNLRSAISSRLPAPLASIAVRFSGTPRGNAAQFDDFQSRCRDTSNGAPWHFVIGNGHRSPDGSIETTQRWLTDPQNSELTICLVGSQDSLTPAQQQAIGELILFMESLAGTLAIRSASPATPEMLAAAE